MSVHCVSRIVGMIVENPAYFETKHTIDQKNVMSHWDLAFPVILGIVCIIAGLFAYRGLQKLCIKFGVKEKLSPYYFMAISSIKRTFKIK